MPTKKQLAALKKGRETQKRQARNRKRLKRIIERDNRTKEYIHIKEQFNLLRKDNPKITKTKVCQVLEISSDRLKKALEYDESSSD